MYTICKFEEQFEKIWDEFVMQKSINGTFLQTRRFLNYHPKQRFVDCSLLVYNEKKVLSAVIPACEVVELEGKTFFSHKGSTFGGIIIGDKIYRAQYLIPLLEELLTYYKENSYQKVVLKNTSGLFSNENMHLLEYVMQYSGFKEYKELSSYVDLSEYDGDILAHFSQGKRTNVHNCIKQGLIVKTLKKEEIIQFYNILCENLRKYDTIPVHSLQELFEFQLRLKGECEFFGCFMGDRMIAGSMMFYFNNVSVAHTQYLAALSEYNKLSPMTFMYYSMIQIMKEKGYSKLSWGIATENMGRFLNMGLITNKESFGSQYSNNLSYCMELS